MPYVSDMTLDSLTLSDLGDLDSVDGTSTQYFPANAYQTLDGDSFEPVEYLIYQLPTSYVGQQIAALPSVSEVETLGSNGAKSPVLLADETNILQISVYAHYTVSSNGKELYDGFQQLLSSGAQLDQVLAQTYSGVASASEFVSLIVPAMPSNSSSMGENTVYDGLYLEIDGSRDDGSAGAIGISNPNQGRFLLTVGQLAGQRAAEWGANWIDDVVLGGVPNSIDQTADLTPDLGPMTESSSSNQEESSFNGLTVDATTGAFSVNGSADAGLTSEVQSYVADGLSVAQATSRVLADATASAAVSGFLVAVQAKGNPYPAAWASVASQIATSVSLATTLRNYYSSVLTILKDELSAFNSGDSIDADSRLNQANNQLVLDATAAFTGPIGSFLSAIGSVSLRIGDGEPEINVYVKDAKDTSTTTLPPGFSDVYFGSDLGNDVAVNANSIAYGGAGNDVLVANASGGDLLAGGLGNDQLIAAGGDDYLDGGAGIDTVVEQGLSSSSSTWKYNANGAWTVSVGTSSTDTLSGVELLQFSNQTISLVSESVTTESLSGDNLSDFVIENAAGIVVVGEIAFGQATYNAVAALGPEWTFEGEGDFLSQGTGRDEFLIENTSGAVVVGDVSSGSVTYTQVGGLGPEWKFIGTGDFRDAGYTQFLIENAAGAVVVGSVGPNGQVNYSQVAGLGPEWESVGVGDFLGVGKSEFLIENSSGAVVVGGLGADGQAVYTQVAALGPEWKFVGTGDFLDDGKSEFLIENTAGAVVVGDVSNGRASYTQVAALGPEWAFRGTGDYLGTGYSQYLIENTSGVVVIGDVINGSSQFSQVAGLGAEWKFH